LNLKCVISWFHNVCFFKWVVNLYRYAASYDYHRVPAPFIQIKLLKILAALGVADKAASSEMYSVLSTAGAVQVDESS
jgi:hypothetical protein